MSAYYTLLLSQCKSFLVYLYLHLETWRVRVVSNEKSQCNLPGAQWSAAHCQTCSVFSFLWPQLLEDSWVSLDRSSFNKFTEQLGFRDGRIKSSMFLLKYEGETEEWLPEHLDQRRQQSYQFCMAGFSMHK